MATARGHVRAGRCMLVWAGILGLLTGGECDVHPLASTGPVLSETDESFDEQVLGYMPQPPAKPDPVAATVPPAQATGLMAATDWIDEVEVIWSDNSTNEEGFIIQRRSGVADWEDYATVGANVYSFIDTGVEAGFEYCYRVVAYNNAGAAEPSPAVCIQLLGEGAFETGSSSPGGSGTNPNAPSRPTGFTPTVTSNRHIQLTWVDTSANESGFRVQRYDSADPFAGWREVASLGAGETQWVDTTAAAGATYCYRVAAFNASGTSTYTDPRCVSVAATSGTETSSPGTETVPPQPSGPTLPPGPKLLPWLELNSRSLIVEDVWGSVEGSEGRATYGQYCIRGLEYWSQVTDVAMITTSPGGLSGTYEYLMANRPAGMRIIGGIKTYSLPGCTASDPRPWNFADAEGWKVIAGQCQHIANTTGTNIVVLENETALTPFHSEGRRIDFQELESSLAVLHATGIEYWWYLPAISESTPKIPDLQEQSITFIETILRAVPNSRFVVAYIGWSGWQNNRRTEAIRRQMMIQTVGQSRIVDFLYVTPDGYWRWDDGTSRYAHTWQDVSTEIEGLPGLAWVSMYPGGKNWVAVARQFAEGFPR